MQIKVGNLWNHPADIVLVTCNATLRADQSLVMGRGAAAQAVRKYPGCDLEFGQMIIGHESPKRYLLLVRSSGFPSRLGIFQVKFNYWEKASLDLIAEASEVLRHAALNEWKRFKISLNYPGIGNGHLSEEAVAPLLDRLPNNVTVWKSV